MDAPLRILLIDDNPDDRLLVTRALRREFPDLQVEQVIDAETFGRAIAAGNYQLAITDFQLHWTNGLEVIRAIKSRWPNCPVVMFTATGSEELAVEAMKSGLEDYVLKSPRHFVRLPAVIRMALARAADRQAVRDAEDRYRSLFAGIPVGLYRTSPEGRILDANPALVEMLGFPDVETLRGSDSTYFYVNLDDRTRWREKIEREGLVRGFEIPIRRLDGVEIWVRDSGRAVHDPQGKIQFYEGTLEEITASKQAEILLRENEARYRSLFQNNHAVMLLIDPVNGDIVDANPAACKFYGYSKEELKSQKITEINTLTREQVRQEMELARHEERSHFIFRHRLANGEIRDVEVYSGPIEIFGKQLLYSIVHDITAQKLAQAALRESQRILSTLISNLPGMAYRCTNDENWTMEYASEGCYPLTGYRPDELENNRVISYGSLIHPDDRQAVRESILTALETNTPFQFEYRITPAGGGEKWVWEQGQGIFAEDGRLVALEGFISDITRRKQAEAEITRLAAVVEQSAESIMVTNLDGNIVYVNPGFEKLTGYRVEEVYGKNPRILKSNLQEPSFYKSLWENITAGRTWSATLINRKKDGTLYHEEGSFFAIKDAFGKIINYAAVKKDVTERVKAEAHLRQQMERLAALRTIDLAITASMDLSVVLNVLLDQTTTQLGVDAAAVLLLRRSSQTLEYAANRGFRTTGIQRTSLRIGEGMAGRAAMERRSISIPNLVYPPQDWFGGQAEVKEQLSRIQWLSDEGFKAYFAVPLVVKGQVKGVLEVFHRDPMTPQPDWLDFLSALAGQAAIAIDNAALYESMQRYSLELAQAYDDTLVGWSRALELRDRETEGHSQRVTALTLQLAQAMDIKDAELVHIRRGTLLHDIGKMGIPDSILSKPGPLTDEEWEIMRRHPTYAYEMLAPIAYLRSALDIPYSHHEKWDGSGYPRGLKGDQIPLPARIFALVDVWDALLHERPYRPAWPQARVLAYIQEQAGSHFDPQVVNAFIQLLYSKK